MTLEKIISGGQTGADRGALEAARVLKFPYGGFIPAGRRAEDGTVPLKYKDMTESVSYGYQARTEMNIGAADGTIVICREYPSGGSKLTVELCKKLNKPWLHVMLSNYVCPLPMLERLSSFIEQYQIKTLNVAGSRESK